jgi:protein phosphatase
MISSLDMAALSDCGRVRAGNEDCVAAQPQVGLAVLADGMGGHNAGEVASRMAVDAIVAGVLAALEPGASPSSADVRALIAGAVTAANDHIHEEGRSSRERAGMGTTVVVALWHGASVTVAHVGDSRFYRLRGTELAQLTRDHTLVQDGLERGALTPEQARLAPARNILTRALGSEPAVEIDLHTHAAQPGDLYLLCSDGLTEMLEDAEIAAVLSGAGESLHGIAEALVERANANGGVDNVSVVLARARGGESAAP